MDGEQDQQQIPAEQQSEAAQEEQQQPSEAPEQQQPGGEQEVPAEAVGQPETADMGDAGDEQEAMAAA